MILTQQKRHLVAIIRLRAWGRRRRGDLRSREPLRGLRPQIMRLENFSRTALVPVGSSCVFFAFSLRPINMANLTRLEALAAPPHKKRCHCGANVTVTGWSRH